MINNYHTRDFSSHQKPKNLVLILHGYGADGANLIDLTNFFAKEIQNPVFIIPDAPFQHEYMPEMGRQWFSLKNRDENILLQGAESARKILFNFIQEKLYEYNLTWKDLIFIGFSQGTMMAMYTALKLEEECKAVIGFSGTVVSAEETIASCKSKPPVCMIHGTDDNIVPCTLGKFTVKILKQNGFNAEFHEIPNLTHSIEMHGIEIAKKFIQSLS
jgi:phospholipase/carboxylesterase